MRTVLNISLPKELAASVRQSVKRGKFATTSEFIRHVIRLWNTHELARELHRRDKDIESGKVKPILLHSLADLD